MYFKRKYVTLLAPKIRMNEVQLSCLLELGRGLGYTKS